jgi:hypothetical protein
MTYVFKPRTTTDSSVVDASKTLLYGNAGWGKTTQFLNYQRTFGKGFIISGEAGLSSISQSPIDYLPFVSWDGDEDAANGIHSFRGICRIMASTEFRAQGYQWIGLDSLTELSDRLMEYLQAKLDAGDYRGKKGEDNKFDLWADYARLMTSSLKWIRDLPFHVLVTALPKEETDDGGVTKYSIAVKGNGVAKQLPGLFDNVFAGIRVSDGDRTAPTVRRFVVTDEVRGWLGKVRDPRRVLKPVEETGDVASLLVRVRDAAKNNTTENVQ